jgi:hypothetical protein
MTGRAIGIEVVKSDGRIYSRRCEECIVNFTDHGERRTWYM